VGFRCYCGCGINKDGSIKFNWEAGLLVDADGSFIDIRWLLVEAL
jgi:hypothetical protein